MKNKQQNDKLNILFIAVDDLRPQLGCYGDEMAHSPNINQLAEGGFVFNRAYCQEAVCNPSRASLMTGRRPDTIKVWDLKTHFRENMPEVVTLPQYFKKQGYHSQSIGKIYHDPESAQDSPSWSVPETLAVTSECGGKYVLEENLKQYYENFPKAVATENADVPDSAYIDGRVAESALAILNTIKDKPFFLAAGFRRPHLPFSAPQEYWDFYAREKLSLAENPYKPQNCPDIALHNWKELRGYTDIPPVGPIDDEKALELIHGYYAAMSYTDAQVGKILAHLEKLGLKDNTVVILWGDHGWHLGEHDLWGKTTNFELDTRSPLILNIPGMTGGRKIEELVEFVDIYPTLCDICDLTIPEELEGESMLSLLQEEEVEWKDAAFSQFPRSPAAPGQENKDIKYENVMGYSMRTDRYRYTEWLDQNKGEVVARELYDHEKDPGETVNIIGKAEEKLVNHLSLKLKRKIE